jgi:hypothetical protein
LCSIRGEWAVSKTIDNADSALLGMPVDLPGVAADHFARVGAAGARFSLAKRLARAVQGDDVFGTQAAFARRGA